MTVSLWKCSVSEVSQAVVFRVSPIKITNSFMLRHEMFFEYICQQQSLDSCLLKMLKI